MRALRVIGLGTDGRTLILESVSHRSGERRERFSLPVDEPLHAAVRGDLPRLGQIEIELESQMRPREIQARIRAGESVEQVASTAGMATERIERFAYPVLLERYRTAELARAAHPVRSDGPDVRSLDEVVAETFAKRGHDFSDVTWDSWRGENGKWIVQLRWQAGRSENRAHWTFHPGAHGGTVTAVDDHATGLIDPDAGAPLHPVAVLDAPAAEKPVAVEVTVAETPEPVTETVDTHAVVEAPAEHPLPRAVNDDGPSFHNTEKSPSTAEKPAAARSRAKGRKERPTVPSWDEVLLGVRSPKN